jgi:hypothetical protein
MKKNMVTNPKAREHLEEFGADCRLIVRLISKKHNMRIWNGIM